MHVTIDDQLVAELLAMTPADRIARCRCLLEEGDLEPAGRARIAYVIAHAQRQAMRPDEAYQMCREALDWDMSAERRAMFMECLALCQYDLGLLTDLPRTLAEWGTLPMTPSVRAHWLMLQGRMLLRQMDLTAFDLFAEAETLFDDASQSKAWAQLSAARLAITVRDPVRALAMVARVTFRPYFPKAQLLRAEALLLQNDGQAADDVAVAAEGGQYGELDGVDRARARYVRAACAIKGGTWSGAILLEEARRLAQESSVRDLELLAAISALRSKAAG